MKKIEINGENSKKIVGYRCSKGLVRILAESGGVDGYILFKPGDLPLFVASQVGSMDKHQIIREGDIMTITF